MRAPPSTPFRRTSIGYRMIVSEVDDMQKVTGTRPKVLTSSGARFRPLPGGNAIPAATISNCANGSALPDIYG
jgi:hypothetical protein